MDYGDGRIGGSAAAQVKGDMPPLSRMASRLRSSLSQLEERMTEVLQTGHRTADRISGEVPDDRPRLEVPVPDNGPPVGYGGQYAELEAEILRAEAMINDLNNRAESMINRITRLG